MLINEEQCLSTVLREVTEHGMAAGIVMQLNGVLKDSVCFVIN